MEQSPRLSLSYVAPSQAQKHVTVNETFRRLDALTQLTVRSRTETSEPGAPDEGDAYIIPSGASGDAWDSFNEHDITAFQDGAWMRIVPVEGLRAWVSDDDALVAFDGASWNVVSGAATGAATFGVNASADATNRLSVKSDAELLSHDDVTPGSGDARKIINKAAAGNTASVVFQNGFSGRAEFGLAGDDDFHLKVSADGSAWNDAALFDRASGAVQFPGGLVDAASGAAVKSFLPVAVIPATEGKSAYRLDIERAINPRSATVDAVASDIITLTTSDAALFFHNTYMEGHVFLRIWNMSKSPIQSAWVKSMSAGDALQVSDAAHIATWSNGDTIQIGDPTSVTPNQVIAVDISPMMMAVFGTVFRQAATMLKCTCLPSSTGDSGLDISPNGLTGSFLAANSFGGQISTVQFVVPNSELSPISNSNLLFFREVGHGGSTIGITLATINGFYV